MTEIQCNVHYVTSEPAKYDMILPNPTNTQPKVTKLLVLGLWESVDHNDKMNRHKRNEK